MVRPRPLRHPAHEWIQSVAVTATEREAGAVAENDGVFAVEERLQFLDGMVEQSIAIKPLHRLSLQLSRKKQN